MDDETDRLSNLCTDLVSLRRYEPALVYLLRDRPAGSWVPVRELYAHAGQIAAPVKPQLVAAWLPSPGDDSGYAVILFLDDDTKWSLTADYNVARLLNQQEPSPAAIG
jgi:hypothetical protein